MEEECFSFLFSGALWDHTPDPPRVFVSFGSSEGASGPEGDRALENDC